MNKNSQNTASERLITSFDEKLPEWFEWLQALHVKVREGSFWTLTYEQTRKDYIDAVSNVPITPFSKQIVDLMDNGGVAINRILEYINREFVDYEELMETGFHECSEVCKDFSNAEYRKKIQERLARENLDSIEIVLAHNDKIETVSIGHMRNLDLSLRYKAFWQAINETLQHRKKTSCNIQIADIEFVY